MLKEIINNIIRSQGIGSLLAIIVFIVAMIILVISLLCNKVWKETRSSLFCVLWVLLFSTWLPISVIISVHILSFILSWTSLIIV